jgi:Family of unknown function (DUF5677)
MRQMRRQYRGVHAATKDVAIAGALPAAAICRAETLRGRVDRLEWILLKRGPMSQKQVAAAVQKAMQNSAYFFFRLKYLDEFNATFVHGVATSLLKPNLEEACYQTLYKRAVLNVRSILTLDNPNHFQAVSMLGRNLFETAVEIKLADQVSNSAQKMKAFENLEKLRAAQKATEFAAKHTLQMPVDLNPYHKFIKSHGTGIEVTATNLLGSAKVKHWSGHGDMPSRVKFLGAPFEEIYHVLYKRFSWDVHPGLAGVVNIGPEIPPILYGIACEIAARGYQEILLSVIRKFRISSGSPAIEKELDFAFERAGAGGDPQIEASLRRERGLPPIPPKPA